MRHVLRAHPTLLKPPQPPSWPNRTRHSRYTTAKVTTAEPSGPTATATSTVHWLIEWRRFQPMFRLSGRSRWQRVNAAQCNRRYNGVCRRQVLRQTTSLIPSGMNVTNWTPGSGIWMPWRDSPSPLLCKTGFGVSAKRRETGSSVCGAESNQHDFPHGGIFRRSPLATSRPQTVHLRPRLPGRGKGWSGPSWAIRVRSHRTRFFLSLLLTIPLPGIVSRSPGACSAVRVVQLGTPAPGAANGF